MIKNNNSFFLKKNIDKKYQNITFNSTELKLFFKKRILFFNKNKNKNKNKNGIPNNNKSSINAKYIETQTILFNFFLKKKLNKKDLFLIYIFYKKFSVNLKLKSKYSYRFKKINNSNTKIDSYIYLASLIIRLPNINIYQKLNTLLKLNDISLLNSSKIKKNYLKFLLSQNIKQEMIMINMICEHEF
jgi:hypothetical protein